jgi:hypothetical protein
MTTHKSQSHADELLAQTKREFPGLADELDRKFGAPKGSSSLTLADETGSPTGADKFLAQASTDFPGLADEIRAKFGAPRASLELAEDDGTTPARRRIAALNRLYAALTTPHAR